MVNESSNCGYLEKNPVARSTETQLSRRGSFVDHPRGAMKHACSTQVLHNVLGLFIRPLVETKPVTLANSSTVLTW